MALPAWWTRDEQVKFWAKRPGRVFGCLKDGEYKIMCGIGSMREREMFVPTELLPMELRIPNARVWIQCDPDRIEPVRIWARGAHEQE
jgi:hypothetical protein